MKYSLFVAVSVQYSSVHSFCLGFFLCHASLDLSTNYIRAIKLGLLNVGRAEVILITFNSSVIAQSHYKQRHDEVGRVNRESKKFELRV